MSARLKRRSDIRHQLELVLPRHCEERSDVATQKSESTALWLLGCSAAIAVAVA